MTTVANSLQCAYLPQHLTSNDRNFAITISEDVHSYGLDTSLGQQQRRLWQAVSCVASFVLSVFPLNISRFARLCVQLSTIAASIGKACGDVLCNHTSRQYNFKLLT